MGCRSRGGHVAICDVCGNDYDKAFRVVTHDGREGTFDSYECAIHGFAPTCGHCACRIIGHGVESDGQMFCCADCARHVGIADVADRAPST